MLSLIIKELEANEISTLKSLWCILNLTRKILLHPGKKSFLSSKASRTYLSNTVPQTLNTWFKKINEAQHSFLK